jgi:hypothetical protein
VLPLTVAGGGCPAVFRLVPLGVGGMNGAVTTTWAVAVTVTSDPLDGVPVAIATFVKLEVRFPDVHVYVTAAPGAIVTSPGIVAPDSAHVGVSASATATFVNDTSPVFVTTIVNDAAEPFGIVCVSGPLTSVRLGLPGLGVAATGGDGGGVAGAAGGAGGACGTGAGPVGAGGGVAGGVWIDAQSCGRVIVVLGPFEGAAPPPQIPRACGVSVSEVTEVEIV